MPEQPVEVVRRLCLALPGVTEKVSHGQDCWFVGTTEKSARQFVAMSDHLHSDDRLSLWAAAPPGAQESLIARDGETFFRPPYVGFRGWVGMHLDLEPLDTELLADVVESAWETVAPARLRRSGAGAQP